MYELNPERNSENMPPFSHKMASYFKFDIQPTIGTNVNHDHNIRVHDSFYILVE